MGRAFVRAAVAAAVTFAGLAFTGAASAGPAETAAAEMQTPRRVMVMFTLGADHYLAGADYGGNYGSAMSEKSRLRAARRIAKDHRLTVVEAWPMQRIGVDCVVMEFKDARTIDAVVAELSQVKGVAWSQSLNEFEMQGSTSSAPAQYNDRLFAAQPVSAGWHLASLHRYATGKGVTIAIIDSRIDQTHPDLQGRIAAAPDFVAASENGGERHGTGVAGIIAARPNNAMGIAGIAPGARILGLRACWERPRGGATICDSLSLAKALNYALDARADVINMSLSGPQDRLLATLIGLAVARGMTVVAAVDQSHPDSSFPATVAGVIPVADEHLSGHGRPVYIAPGRDVPTTEPEGKWSLVSGSSYAAAHVSGLAALLRQLSGNRMAQAASASMFGPRGRIDACAMVARLSPLDASACMAKY